MDFLQTLRAHVGGLIRLKSQLYWYDSHRWDNSPGRICLVLDASAYAAARPAAAAHNAAHAAAVLLLIDDTPRWIWVSQADVELIS